MARIRKVERLSKSEQESLVFDLVYAMVQTKSVSDGALLLQDLLTKSEITILGKRLRIAKLLISGASYEEIEKKLKVSHATIAKIAAWLTDRGEGFRKIVKSLLKNTNEKNKEFSDWDKYKRRHGMYFWPELVLEEVIKNSNRKQKEKIRSVLEAVEEKSELHKRLDKLLKYGTT